MTASGFIAGIRAAFLPGEAELTVGQLVERLADVAPRWPARALADQLRCHGIAVTAHYAAGGDGEAQGRLGCVQLVDVDAALAASSAAAMPGWLGRVPAGDAAWVAGLFHHLALDLFARQLDASAAIAAGPVDDHGALMAAVARHGALSEAHGLVLQVVTGLLDRAEHRSGDQ